ncbi:hypothetical protein GE09DRAFT_1110316 [Coniochaeta sp. 2T2.1]|nr:hypothetical protein GE09DRAFT_1110316 [Coniochaeta sp. 2T2.1]
MMKLSILSACLALFSPVLSRSFDGPYQTDPEPGPGNSAVEWWWYAITDTVTSDGVVPSFEAIFYKGFAFTRAPTDPDYRFDISGVFPNGTTFFFSTPVSAPALSTAGDGVSGNWGNGLGKFVVAPDRSRVDITFNNDAAGFSGSIVMINQGTPPRTPCNNLDDPYFGSLANGLSLNVNETVLFKRTGWAVTMPRAASTVNVKIQGSPFVIENGIGYHDHNWAPQSIDKFGYTWLTGQGSCGPFDLSYLEVQGRGSPRSRDITNGFLAYDGHFLQNECSLYGSKTKDFHTITLTGQVFDPASGVDVPTGLTLDYHLANGSHYHFVLKNSVQNPSRKVYHRWPLYGRGGLVGGTQYDCLLISDWLNPGLATYKQGESIFDQQPLS